MAKRKIRNSILGDIFGKKVTYHSRIVRSGENNTSLVTKYKGVNIKDTEEGFRLSKIDKDSIFDSVSDAKKFIDYAMKHRLANPPLNTWIKVKKVKVTRNGVQILR